MYYFLKVIFAIALTVAVSNLYVLAFTHQQHRDASTLVLVNCVFRHGNRTTDFSYPTDPHINETYYPFGLGQLTNEGKRRGYLLGKALLLRYNGFLGLYTPDLLDPVSSVYNRTKMSLEVVLAGLFPPKGTPLEWDKDFNWSPIPYNYLSYGEDHHLLSVPLYYCPKYARAYEDYLNSPPGLEEQQKYSELFQYLSKHTGSNITSLVDVFLFHIDLVAQDDWGLKLPAWTKQVFPKQTEEATGEFFSTSSSTTLLKQLSGGFLLQKIIKDTQALINGTLSPSDRKLFLYSAHDYNVAYILNVMGVFVPHEPPYAAYVSIEVHKINNVYGIKIFYQDYSNAEPKLLKVPGCDSFCPFGKFVELLQKYLPVGDDPCNDGDLSALNKYLSKRKYF